MKRRPNPFETGAIPTVASEPLHPSDDPGREYGVAGTVPDQQVRSSGASGPSEPRRPGTGERQAPRRQTERQLDDADPIIPGEILYGPDDVEINQGLEVTTITVINGADRPIQVGSHYHFAEVNSALEFDRDAAWGKRLNVLSGGAMRFEPGAVEEVPLVPIQGRRIVPGLRGLCGGNLDD